MNAKRLLAPALAFVLLAASSLYAQNFPSAPGNEPTGSFGRFQILVEPGFVSLFTGCPGFDSSTRIFTSPTLYDSNTQIGVSAATTEGTPPENGAGIDVGSPAVKIGDSMMSPPAGFPAPAAGTREVHTQIRSLNMNTFPGVPPSNNVNVSIAPGVVSPGEVDSQSSSGSPANDFPARSFFDVFVQVSIPQCGGLPAGGATLHNRHNQPLKVQADGLTSLPPKVVYLHELSTPVPILFSAAGPHWRNNQALGCFIFAGHQVGVEHPESEREGFEGKMHGHEHHGPGGPACPPEPRGGGPSSISIVVLGGLAAAWALIAVLRGRRRESYNG
jgi:hypothetical protein